MQWCHGRKILHRTFDANKETLFLKVYTFAFLMFWFEVSPMKHGLTKEHKTITNKVKWHGCYCKCIFIMFTYFSLSLSVKFKVMFSALYIFVTFSATLLLFLFFICGNIWLNYHKILLHIIERVKQLFFTSQWSLHIKYKHAY